MAEGEVYFREEVVVGAERRPSRRLDFVWGFIV